MIVHTETRMWGQSAVVILEHKRGKVVVMDDDAEKGGLKFLTREAADWASFSETVGDEEDTLA